VINPVSTGDSIDIILRRLKIAYAKQQLANIKQDIELSEDPYKCISKIQDVLDKSSHIISDKPQPESISKLSEALEARYQQMKTNKGVMGISFPFPSLSKATGGMFPASLYVLYGRKKSYKTTIALYTGVVAAEKGYRVYIVSGELQSSEMHATAFACFAKINRDNLLMGNLSELDEKRKNAAYSVFNELPLKFGSKPDPGVHGADALARESAKFGADLIIIDGAHRLSKTRDWEKVAEYADRLLDHSIRNNKAYLAVCQANRMSVQWLGKKTADVVDSDVDIGGTIAWIQNARVALRTRKIHPGRVEIDITDNRYANTDGTTIPVHIEVGQRIEELIDIDPDIDGDHLRMS
jgi:hypothetical protein